MWGKNCCQYKDGYYCLDSLCVRDEVRSTVVCVRRSNGFVRHDLSLSLSRAKRPEVEVTMISKLDAGKTRECVLCTVSETVSQS